MRTLVFKGSVHSNKGRFHREMVVPGRETLRSSPTDWPAQFAPGTLNIQVDLESCVGLGEIGSSVGVKKFDEGQFKPALVIPQNEIVGNTLKPKAGEPQKGTGQAWRAELLVNATGATTKCWMLRRIGSSIASQIELISEDHLRNRLNLNDGTQITLTVFEG
jgi:hypothetical protein